MRFAVVWLMDRCAIHKPVFGWLLPSFRSRVDSVFYEVGAGRTVSRHVWVLVPRCARSAMEASDIVIVIGIIRGGVSSVGCR